MSCDVMENSTCIAVGSGAVYCVRTVCVVCVGQKAVVCVRVYVPCLYVLPFAVFLHADSLHIWLLIFSVREGCVVGNSLMGLLSVISSGGLGGASRWGSDNATRCHGCPA